MYQKHSRVELVSSNNKNDLRDEFQMRIKTYPDLPNFQSTKKISKYLIKIPFTGGGYASEFSKHKTSFNVRYEVICKNICEYLEVNDLKIMKINGNDYFQETDVQFLAFCSICMCEINKLFVERNVVYIKYAPKNHVTISLTI